MAASEPSTARAENRAFVFRSCMEAAMRRARYEFVADGGAVYGEIPGLDGVSAGGATLEECEAELASAVEGWAAAWMGT